MIIGLGKWDFSVGREQFDEKRRSRSAVKLENMPNSIPLRVIFQHWSELGFLEKCNVNKNPHISVGIIY